MKILISMISNRPDQVQRFLQMNNHQIKSSKHDISLLVNFNNLEELPKLETYSVPHTFRLVDPLKDSDGKYHWNTTRLSNTLDEFEFDYIHLLDDDVYFKFNMDYIYDNLEEKHDFVAVTANNIDDVYNSVYEYMKDRKEPKKPVQYRKVEGKIINNLKITAGGHILSRKFLENNYDRIVSYDDFNEDTWRSYIALKYGNCYYTKNRLALYNYDAKNYNPEQRYISLNRFIELEIPVWVNDFNSIEPLLEKPTSGCTKVGDFIYCNSGIRSSLVNKFINRNKSVSVVELR